MDLSAVIFVVLALAWALYLIPKALKHHDEVARTRSIDRFSKAMRVLARREPVNRREARLVVTPPRQRSRMLLPTQAVATVSTATVVTASQPVTASMNERPSEQAAPAQDSSPAARRPAARAAARRRRRILYVLLLAGLVVVGVATFGYLPRWSVAIPGGVLLGYLLLCRVLVRRSRRTATHVAEDEQPGTAPRRPAARVHAPFGAQLDRNPFADPGVGADPDEDTVGLSTAALAAALSATTAEEADAVAAAAASASGVQVDSLWDPLPVTLPTYVGKPQAHRTVRTIDLSAPDSWSSGRSEADSRLVDEVAAAAREATTDDTGEQRAVGS